MLKEFVRPMLSNPILLFSTVGFCFSVVDLFLCEIKTKRLCDKTNKSLSNNVKN